MNYLIELFTNLEEDKVIEAVKDEIKKDTDPMAIIEACQSGMVEVGDRFEKNTYYLPELLIAAELFNAVMDILADNITGDDSQTKGTIVLGTVKGDLHDIGKNIFKILAEVNGFKVCDLGIDVPAGEFVEAVKKENAQIVGLSGLLTTVFTSMQEVVESLREAGLRDKVKVIIGGAPVDESIMKMVGSDAFTRNASEGISVCKSWVNA
ncbi:MAG: cobalamin B12-binding domain-containing protein [Thermacetogeniaceae bacterium]|jgi:dimethylamine corrinoid protein|nr:cobalamin-dependent protein [Thermoanaerobacterales bacterium]NLN20979.1 cobalamin-binding protein [Syntrophomonadaceae bacterium]